MNNLWLLWHCFKLFIHKYDIINIGVSMRANKINLTLGTEKIYEEAEFYLNEQDRIGIVGVNGAGKTTLFKVILGEIPLDSGTISFERKRKIGYLEQEMQECDLDCNVLDYLLKARPIEELRKKQVSLYEKLTHITEQQTKKYMKELSKIEDLLEYYDCYHAENTLFELIEKMHIDSSLLDKKVKELSGGQKSKISFLHLLYSNPEVLLLDEPTNHLDASTKEFITEYLKNYKGMLLVISHDVPFLNAIVNQILYIDKTTHKMNVYKGNYDDFIKKREVQKVERERQIKREEEEEEKLRKIVLKYSNSSGKRKRMAESREKALKKLEKNKIEKDMIYKTVKLNIKPEREGSKIPLKVNNIYFGYKEEDIIHNLSFLIQNKERFLIVGENGVGKSTLLKLLIGENRPREGNIWYGSKTDIAYYAQEQELLEPKKTILENVDTKGYSEKELRTVLGNFLFFKEDVFKKVEVLSPGEKARVALAKIILKKANLLLLDEPTNHLDVETQRIIGENFKNYEGTIIMVSHNPDFVESVGVNRMLLLPKGKIMNYSKELILKIKEKNKEG